MQTSQPLNNRLEIEAPDTVSKPGNLEGLPLRIVLKNTNTPIMLASGCE